ncbi:MAG: nitrilase-related carbon-nitrogen hydrolase [Planctomycetota bacterium]
MKRLIHCTLPSMLGVMCLCGHHAEGQDTRDQPKRLRVAVAQIPVTADIAANVDTISRAIDQAIAEKAEVLLTPEGSLSGYTHQFDQAKVDEALRIGQL